MLVNATAMLQSAEKGHYGIGAFNTNNLESASSILDAAEALQSPVIIQCTSGAAKWQTSFKVVSDIVHDLVEAKNITVPVALHLDHGSYEAAFECIEAGFTSVMYDGSHEPDFETNLRRTAEVVKAAHNKGISVEAEVGGIGGTEDGVTSAGSLPTPSSAPRSPTWASTSSPAASATSTASIPPIGRASPLSACSRSRPRRATCLSSSTAAPAFPSTRSRRPSLWASARSTLTPTSSSSSPRRLASTSSPAPTRRARATTRASSCRAARPSSPAPRSSSRSLAPRARAGTS